MRTTLARWLMPAIVFLALSGSIAAAQDQAKEMQGTVVRTESGDKVVINSKMVTYSFPKHLAVFEQDVTCTDSNIMINCDRLAVQLTEANKLRQVEAEGNVVIRELGTAKKATAGKAIYDVAEDTVVLTEKPRLEEREQGFFTKGADRIIYYRKQQEFKAEGDNMQIEFGIPEDKAGRPADLFGTTNDKESE